jgi:hypothetical protein
MDQTLRDLCKQHGLTGMSVMLQFDRYDLITVYLHWSHIGCASGSGKTFEEAFAAGIDDKAARSADAARHSVEAA